MIDKKSSTTILHQSFANLQIDSDLLSGMLSALNQLSEVEMRGKGIESIEMGGLSWVYINYEAIGIMLIAADVRGTNVDLMRARLEVILREFLQAFDISKPEDWEEIWTGEYSKFEPFKEVLNQLIEQWDMAETALGAAELFDMLGVFQQLFNTFQKIYRINLFNEKLSSVREKLERFYTELGREQLDSDELKKITFNGDTLEWSVLMVNPQLVNSSRLKQVLLAIVREMKQELVGAIGRMLGLQEMSNEVFPFLVQNMSMFERLGVEKEIIEIFLL
ncbi:MAG: hypothetical protein ACTSU5_12935 [Promethearchaeota archaeon]